MLPAVSPEVISPLGAADIFTKLQPAVSNWLDDTDLGGRHVPGPMTTPETQADGAAERVVVSYPADLSQWGRNTVEDDPFRAYLGKTLGTVNPEETVEAFVGVGCCGDTLDVPLRIEAIEGGDTVTEETAIVYEVREACDIDGGWAVQSAEGP